MHQLNHARSPRITSPTRFGAMAGLAAALAFFAPAHAQEGQGPGAQVSRDAQQYATDRGVTVGEAMRRLQQQRRAAQFEARLTAAERATFGGLYIDQGPKFRVVAKFTRDPAAAVRRNNPEPELAGDLEAVAAERTLAELQETQMRVYEAITRLGVRGESGIDIPAGRVKMYVLDQGPIQQAVSAGTLQIPDFVDVIKVNQLSRREVNMVAGLTLNGTGGPACTSGFTVRNSAGTRGVLTAGHCPNTLSYNGTNLPFQAERFTVGTKYDFQWHTAPGFTVVNQMYEGLSTNRTITSTTPLASQTVGGYVCKYGMTTGYTCGDIADKNYILDGSGGFVRVHHPSNSDLSQGGDSGGPWFLSNSAYGVHTASADAVNSNDAVYQPIDYISVLSLTVLTAP